jgi:hypothetical protein
MDGTPLEAWKSLKSFQPKNKQQTTPPDDPGNPTVDFHGEKCSNQTDESKTDPDAKLARKDKEAKLSYSGNLLVEKRNGIDRQRRVAGSQRSPRARCGAADAGTDSGRGAHYRGWRQGI